MLTKLNNSQQINLKRFIAVTNTVFQPIEIYHSQSQTYDNERKVNTTTASVSSNKTNYPILCAY